jgi:hypothetical protein
VVIELQRVVLPSGLCLPSPLPVGGITAIRARIVNTTGAWVITRSSYESNQEFKRHKIRDNIQER